MFRYCTIFENSGAPPTAGMLTEMGDTRCYLKLASSTTTTESSSTKTTQVKIPVVCSDVCTIGEGLCKRKWISEVLCEPLLDDGCNDMYSLCPETSAVTTMPSTTSKVTSAMTPVSSSPSTSTILRVPHTARLPCEKGNRCPDGGAQIACDSEDEFQDESGWSRCKDVSPGEYKVKAADPTNSEVMTCPRGFKCPGDGSRARCSGNTVYQPNSGMKTCKAVSPGFMKISDTERSDCGIGYYCSIGNTLRIPCSAANLYANTTRMVKCDVAEPTGFYVIPEGSGQPHTAMVLCDKGFMCTNGSRLACVEDDKYQPSTGQAECIPVTPGFRKSGNSAREICVSVPPT